MCYTMHMSGIVIVFIQQQHQSQREKTNGIYSAAMMYDLDFVPVCIEQYDLIIPDSAWDTPMVKELIEVLKSEQFKARLNEMGGYTLENPGEVRLKL